MKVRFEIDMTPEEFRKAFGLPEVTPFYDELVAEVIQKMQSGEEGYDPFTLLQPIMKSGFSNFEKAQQTMMAMMSGYAQRENK
jgi:hypothetical protein